MWKFALMVNLFWSFLLPSIIGVTAPASPDDVSQVEKAINYNFEKTNGDHPSPNVTNRANYSHSISLLNNTSDLLKPSNEKKNSSRNITTYEVQEPGKKHSEREVKIVYEASKSSANVLPKGQDLKNVPYNYNTSIKYSSKYSLIPQESRHINTTENSIEDDEDYDDDEEEEEEEDEEGEEEEDDKAEVEEKRYVEEKIRENEKKIKKPPPVLDKPPGTYEEEKRKRLQTEKIVINRVEEEEESKPEEILTEKPKMVNRHATETLTKYKKEREELTEKPPITEEGNHKYISKPPHPKSNKTYKTEGFSHPAASNLESNEGNSKYNPNSPPQPKPYRNYKTIERPLPPNLNSVNDKGGSKFNPVIPAKVRDGKTERRSGIYPGQANYIITSSSKINSPQRPQLESDLKNEQSRYYWRNKDDDDDEEQEEIRPFQKDQILSLKVLPTEPVKILEEEMMTSHPYEDPQPVSFSSVVFNPGDDSESTSELSGSYYDKTPNVPNVIRARIDDREDEEEEVSENSMEDTKSVPYTTPNYYSIQTPLNDIKFIDTYAYLNPFAEGKNNFPYKYESESPKVIVYEEKPPVEDVLPFRATLFPEPAAIEKPAKPFTLRPELELRHPVEEQSINEYRLSAEELRQREKDRLRNQNDIAEDELEQRKPTPPTKIQYPNKLKIKSENNEDESSEYRPNRYKQTKLIAKPELSEVEELYPDRDKHHPKAAADLFNYNVSSTRPRYPYQDNSNPENGKGEPKYNPNRPPYPKPYQNEGYSRPAASNPESSEGDPKYNPNRPPYRKPYTNEGYSRPAASNPGSSEGDTSNWNRPPYPKPYQNEGYSRPAASNPENSEGDPKYNPNRPPYRKPYTNEGYSRPAASNPESSEGDPRYHPNRPPQPHPYETYKNERYPPRHADPNLINDKEHPKYDPNRPAYQKPYKSYKNESSRALYNSHLNNIKESNERFPVTSLPNPRYKNEEENIYSRRPQKFSYGVEEEFTTPQIKPVFNEITTKSTLPPLPPPLSPFPPKDNKNEQTEIREPPKNSYIEPVNNIFSPEAKLNFESLDENDDMYQQILENIESLFGIRTSSLLPTANEKDTFIPTPIIPVDYQPYLQPHFEGNSYENLKKNEESNDSQENRSDDNDDDEEDEESENDEENDSERLEDEDESEDESDYDDANDDGSEQNSNVQKVRSTDRPKSKRKLKTKYKFTITKEKPKKLKKNHFRNQIPLEKDKSEEWEEELRNKDPDASVEVTTASYNNVLTSRPAKFIRKPKYPPQGAKLIIKDVHSSPVDQKVIRVIVPKIITKDNVAIPTHSKIIIRKQKTGF